MRTALGVGIAGALGALARYGVDSAIERHGLFPWATFVVNLSGAFLLGLIFALVVSHGSAPQWLRTSLTVGLLGAYTTFSTLSYDTLTLIEWKAYGLAAFNAVGSLGLGVFAVYLGMKVGSVLRG
jgi:fluoride exporter